MAINKSFWITDDKKKLNKNFWVKEPVKNLASVQTTQSQASLSADNVQSRIAELDNLMRETDLKIRQQAKYTPEERSEFQRQYGAYNKEYYSLKKELEAMNPVKIERPTISEDIPKTYISNKVQQSAGNKVANFFKTTVPEVAEDVWDNIKEPFTGPSLKQVMTEAKLSPKLLVEDAKIQMEKEDPTREDYALVKQTQEAIRKYGMPDSNVRAITEDTSTLQEQLKRAEKTWQVSPIDAAVANIGAGGAGFLGDVAGFTNMLGADKVPVLKDINNAIISTAEVLQENAQDYNVGTYGNYLGNLTQVITRMVPYFLAGTGKAVTEGSKVAKVVLSTLKNPSFWVSLTTMAGQKYNENMNNGVDRGKSTLNALLYAIPAALVEVQGGIGAQGKEAQSLLKTIIEENFEEISQDIIEGTADKITTKKDMPVYSTSEDAIINPKEMLESVLYTTPATFLTGGVSRAYNNRIANIAENQRVQAQINQDIQNYKNGSDVTKYIPQNIKKNEMLRIQSENVNNFPKNNVQKSSQTQNIQQDNVTLPTQAEMAQRANVSEIEEDKQNSIINKINNNQYLSQKEKNELISTVNTTNITPEVEAEINNILNTVNAEFGLKNITNDFNANKSNYTKYFNDKTDIDSSYINNAKSAVNTSDGRRTKDQWLSVAKSLGSQIYEMSDADVEKYAYRTWIENRPNNAQNLNRQGKKYVKFGLDEWVNTVYDSVREARNRIIPTNENPLPTQRVQETLQSAKLAGMTDMDIKRVTDLHKMLQSGTNLRFYDPQNIPQGVDIARAADANGFYQNGTLWLNKNSEMKVERILGHELTHHVENDDLINTILDSNIFYDFLSEKGFSNTTEFKNYLMEKKGYKQHELNSEMVAHFAEEKLFGKEETINRLARENRTLAQKILNWLSDLRTKIAGSTEAKELLRIENMYRKALEQARSMTNTSNISYSIGENVNGQFVKVDTDQDIFDGINEKDYNKIAKMYIKDYLIGDTPLGIEGDIATIDSKTANKYTNPGKKQKYFNEKMKLTPELKNVLQIAKKDSNAKPIKENSKYANWEYYTVNFEIAGRMFECTLNIGVDSNGGKHLYEINKIHPVSILQTSANRSNEMYSNNSIPQNENTVNVEYSLNNKNDTADGKSAFSLPENRLEDRLTGDALLDAQDLIDELKSVNAQIDENGYVTVYHRTDSESANKIYETGKMKAKEDGVFFSTSENGINNSGYGSSVISLKVPVEKLVIDDIFADEASVKIPLKNKNEVLDIKEYIYKASEGTDRVSFSLPETDNQGRTLSKEQQEFFKDSKVRDENGKLKTMYHFTNDTFNKIDFKKNAQGLFWLTDDKNALDDGNISASGLRLGKDIITKEVYVNMKKPAGYEEYDKYTIQQLKDRGYDGILFDDGEGTIIGAIFNNSNQIKNVDNTNPTSNPDIRYSMNPVDVAKNPPSPQNGLDKLKRSSRENEGDKQSSFAKNILNQNIFDDKFKRLALDDKNIRTYESISNKETLQEANDAINEQGQKWVDRFLDKGNSEMKATDIAGGFILMNRYQQVGDYESMIRVAEKLRRAGTQQGQTIQLFSVLGRMTPEGMTYYAQKELSKAYDEILKNKTQKWADEHADDFKLNDRDIEFIQRRVNQAAKLPEGRDKYVLLGEIASRIQNKIPPEPGQSIKALARNSMLLNPKTMVRNILGNVVIVPNHIISDFVGTGIDKVISKKTGIRTTGITDPKDMLKGAKKGLYESFDDFRRGISTREIAGDRFEIGGGKSFNENHTGRFATQRNAINRALNGVDRVTGYLLESGDRPFYEAWFINSLNNQMKLNNVTEPTAEMIEIATDEALQRTWQDNNTYTKSVNSVRKALNNFNIKGYGLGDMVMPFVKTPANLTKAVVDFSPLGAINAALKTSTFRKDIGKGVATSKQQREVVKAWSQVITGSLGMAIMTAMANAGVLGGGSDEDKDVRSFEQNVLGIKPYSIKIGDKSYTYDWAQPLGTSAAMVADTVKSLKSATDTESKVGAVLKGLQSGASVLLEQSFVSGIRNLFEEDNLINALIETGFNEASKFTPQFLSQIAQLQDDTARTSYVYNDIPKTALNKVKAKIPGLRQTLEPSVDVLGREVKTDNSVGNVMFNPTNTAFARTTKGAEEMYRVYQATGDKAAIAQVAPYYFNVGSEKVVLTPAQRTQYQKTIGKIASDGVENLLENKAYKALPDTDKAEILKELFSYGNAIAKEEASSSYLLPGAMEKIKNSGMNPEEYILLKYISTSGGTKKDEMYGALISAGYSKKESEAFLSDYKGYKFESTAKSSSLPTLAEQRAKLPSLKK